MVSNYGQTLPNMKASGQTIKQTAKENLSMLMVMFIMANGLMIRLTVLELTLMQMVLITMENG